MYGIAKENSIDIRKCAFCKHWYDPTNSVIEPKRGNGNYWKYDIGERKLCRLKKYDTLSQNRCSNFECKL